MTIRFPIRFPRWFTLMLVLGLVVVFSVACGTIKAWMSGSPDTVTRFLADIGCIKALADAGIQVSGDPTVSNAKTALGVLGAVSAIGGSNIPATVLTACKDTFALGSKDADAAAVIAANTSGTDAPKAVMPRATAPPEQPKSPQPVVIPVPKKK